MRCLKIIFILLFLTLVINARQNFVDQTISPSATATYNPTTRSSTGGSYRAFKTLQMGLDSVVAGDTLWMRGGTYSTIYDFDLKTDGTGWGAGQLILMKSYPGEWAILDGNNNIQPGAGWGALLGPVGAATRRYWRMEMFELRNARASGGNVQALFFENGPFYLKHLVFRDIVGTQTVNNNPGVVCGHTWDGCTIERCLFIDCGNTTSHQFFNAIQEYGDYLYASIPRDGFDWSSNGGHHACRNEFKYNLFLNIDGGVVHQKGTQQLTGRNPPSHPYVDTYKEYGDKIHHNIFKNIDMGGSYYINTTSTDFLQIYNNIFDSCNAIGLSEVTGNSTAPHTYRPCVYNNTFRDVKVPINYIWQLGSTGAAVPATKYGFIANNIFDNCDPKSKGVIAIQSSYTGTKNVDSVYIKANYNYRPTSTSYVMYIFGTAYSAATWDALDPDYTYYQNAYDAGDPLWRGTTGALKYLPYSDHEVSGSSTIANGGIGGNHPYKSGVTIPSYIGAVNPSDSTWVAEVLGLINLGAEYEPDTGDTGSSPVYPPDITSISPESPRLLKPVIINGVVPTDTIYFNSVKMDSVLSTTDTSQTLYVKDITRGYFWLKAINPDGRDSLRIYVKETDLDTVYIQKYTAP